MKVKVIQEKENPLLGRKEMVLQITAGKVTPTFSEARDKIASAIKAKKDVVVVQSVKSKFGSRETIATAKVYSTNKRALEVEMKHKLVKNFEGKPKKESKPKEAPVKKEEKPKAEDKPPKAEEKAVEKGAEKAPKAEEKVEEKAAEEAPQKAEEKPAEEKPAEEKGSKE